MASQFAIERVENQSEENQGEENQGDDVLYLVKEYVTMKGIDGDVQVQQPFARHQYSLKEIKDEITMIEERLENFKLIKSLIN